MQEKGKAQSRGGWRMQKTLNAVQMETAPSLLGPKHSTDGVSVVRF